MVDAADLKSAARKGLWVRIPPPAPIIRVRCVVLTRFSQAILLQRSRETEVHSSGGSEMTGTYGWRSLGTQGGHVEIAEYDLEWPRIFAHEAGVILKACRPWITEVHHVGSTSMPGLAAKPILDMVPIAANPVECANAISRDDETGVPISWRKRDSRPLLLRQDHRRPDDRARPHAASGPSGGPQTSDVPRLPQDSSRSRP